MTHPYRTPTLLFGLFCLVLYGAMISHGYGLYDLYAVIQGASDIEHLILQEIQLPRLLLAAAIGFAFGLGGAALQGLLRNPLAEPAVLGISASASLGAVLAFYFGMALQWVPLSGLAASLIALGLLTLCTRHSRTPLTLILVGLALNTFAVSLTALAINLAPNPYARYEITFWLLGSLNDRTWMHFGYAFPFIALGCLLMFSQRRKLMILSLGEDQATTLGISIPKVQLMIALGVAFAVGASVAVAGNIGFVGLIVPHILRPIVGYRPDRLLLSSGLGGAILLILADCLIQHLPLGQELNLGVLTALLGGPIFIFILYRMHRMGVQNL